MKSTIEILKRATDGHRVTCEEGLALFQDASLTDLGVAADEFCRRIHPTMIRTYVVDRNINYTNVCVSGCQFCAFYREPGAPDAYVLSEEEIFNKIEEAIGLGATQILMQGGLHPELAIDYHEKMIRSIKERFQVHLHSFSPPEVVHIARISGLTVEQTLRRLRDAGLDSLPGGGAEILAQGIRRRVSPRKCTSDEWIDVMRAAHHLDMPTTATMMFGYGETYSDRIEHLSRIRDLQDETGGFTAFIPWTFQPENTAIGGMGVGGYEYLRTLAICRLFLDNVRNIQASWVTQGAKVGQVALFFGANDLGGTMIEENVVAAAGANFRMTEDEIRLTIAEAGYIPCRRDTYYNLLEEPGRL